MRLGNSVTDALPRVVAVLVPCCSLYPVHVHPPPPFRFFPINQKCKPPPVAPARVSPYVVCAQVLSTWGRNLTRPIRHSIPWVHINTTDVVQPFGDSLDSLQCEWTGFMHTSEYGSSLATLACQHLSGYRSASMMFALASHAGPSIRLLALAYTTPPAVRYHAAA